MGISQSTIIKSFAFSGNQIETIHKRLLSGSFYCCWTKDLCWTYSEALSEDPNDLRAFCKAAKYSTRMY